MDDEGNIVTDQRGLGMVVGTSGQIVTPTERIIDAGHVEKCVTDVRELVGDFFQYHLITVTFFSGRSVT